MPQGKPRPALFRALGRNEPPPAVAIGGVPYALREIFKHDSWAATALYASAQGELAVVKFNRRQSLLGLPASWVGRWLAARERWFLNRLAGIAIIPRCLPAVTVENRPAPNAVARAYISGHPLGCGERVADEFFPTLRAELAHCHERGVAYVDLHKRENIVVGDDARPYLVDFQVAAAWPRIWPASWLLRLLQEMDRHHVDKHVRICRPDQFACSTREWDANRPWYLKLHRLIAEPLRQCRRRLLVWLGIRTGQGFAASESFAEDAVRRELEPQSHCR